MYARLDKTLSLRYYIMQHYVSHTNSTDADIPFSLYRIDRPSRFCFGGNRMVVDAS